MKWVDFGVKNNLALRSRVADIENALINTNDFIDNDIAPSVQANTDSIKSLESSIDDIESTLSCSGSAELDVCGCPFGYTYYHGDCVASDEKAARNWIDEFNEGYQVHVHDYTTHYFAYETNITDHNLEEANKASGESIRFEFEGNILSSEHGLIQSLILSILYALFIDIENRYFFFNKIWCYFFANISQLTD